MNQENGTSATDGLGVAQQVRRRHRPGFANLSELFGSTVLERKLTALHGSPSTLSRELFSLYPEDGPRVNQSCYGHVYERVASRFNVSDPASTLSTHVELGNLSDFIHSNNLPCVFVPLYLRR